MSMHILYRICDNIYNNNNKYYNMKKRTIKLLPTAFYRFRLAALAVGLFFMCSIQNGEYTVEAEDSELENLGY